MLSALPRNIMVKEKQRIMGSKRGIQTNDGISLDGFGKASSRHIDERTNERITEGYIYIYIYI